MTPQPDAEGQDASEENVGFEGGELEAETNFADLLGPDCVIRRVDKDRNVIGGAKPQEMQQELMTRASAQKRIGACAEHVAGMNRTDKMQWALDLKEKANEFYMARNFEEAAKLYNDCLVALDFEGSPEENATIAAKLQLPVCTNLAACMIEIGSYMRVVEICDLALSVDSGCPKALYRRGLARYRMGDHAQAFPDLEAALSQIHERRGVKMLASDDKEAAATRAILDDLERRVHVYLTRIRQFGAQERARCQRMFDKSTLYADRPDAGSASPESLQVDDSDEAIDAALARRRTSCCCCSRRRSEKEKLA